MPPADAYHAVGESLQADVMRFMAIIAFCLMAILALVRGVDPAGPEAAALPESRESPESPARQAPPQSPPAQPVAGVVHPRAEPAAPPPDDTRPPAPAKQQGLTLRFASDRDFLRLVNKGDIRVFAFRDGEVLSVSPDFHFTPATAPERLHELLPDTIPDLLGAALRGSAPTAAYRWGIAMPETMARRIRGYLERGVSGELVIDRFGEVRLHEA